MSVVPACRRPAEPSAPPTSDAPSPPDAPAVLYCSVDEAFARDILARYEQSTGHTVKPIFDSEAGKTTGLVRRIQSEAGRAGADVFWSGEIFNTIILARQGLLVPYDSPAAADVPERYRDGQRRWTAFGLRARVLAFDTARVDKAGLPTTWEAYAQGEWPARLVIANPVFGTTRGHVSAMFALWGEPRGRAFLQALAGKAVIADGNSSAVRMVIGGAADLCFTDSDDVIVARRSHPTLDCIHPDLGDGGTLLIPNTVALVKGGANAEAGRRMIDFLASAEVERLLAQSDSGNIPVRAALREELQVTMPAETKLTYDAIADAMEPAIAAAREILLR